MKKSKIEFYINESKTEFLFESDAEKAVLREASKAKRPKVYKKIIRNSIILSSLLVCAFVLVYNMQSEKLLKLSASLINDSKNNKKIEEKMNGSSENLELINNNYSKKYEIIINKANPITEDTLKNYKQVEVKDNVIENVKLETETYKSYLKLKENLLERGYYINVRSGFRSFAESEEVYNYYAYQNGEIYAEKYVAKPGVSEHNAGIAFDFIISRDKMSLKTDYQSDEYKYLENIAYLYGFIIRYPKNKENITGYSYEPWHLRYVGTELAKYLTKNNLTLEEYYETRE